MLREDPPAAPPPAPCRPGCRLQRAPGARLRRLARLWTSWTVYSTVFAPLLDEMEAEYFAALAAGDDQLARAVLLRGRVAFWLAPATALLRWIRGIFF